MNQLTVEGITKRFGGVRALDDCSFVIDQPGLYGIIGPNGAGKTTLFDIIAGEVEPDAGAIRLGDENATHWPIARRARLGIARSFQECRVIGTASCLDNLLYAAQPKALGASLANAFALRRRVEPTLEAQRLLELVKLDRLADTRASDLSFGQRRLLELVCTFIRRPAISLLDEPAAGVNPQLLETLTHAITAMIRERPTITMIVEHNIDFIMSLADEIIVMHQGRVLERGRPDVIRASREVREAYLG